jgi:hypothetical protein
MDVTGRIGTALHKTLEALTSESPLGQSEDQFVASARRRFAEEMQLQEELRATRPREQWLPSNPTRRERAEDAIIIEAQRCYSARHVTRQPLSGGMARPTAHTGPRLQAEVSVASKDRLFRGRVDYAETDERGTRIIDVKSAVKEDVPERYRRQVQLYALLWRDTTGTWPVSAAIIYPLTGTEHEVSIDPATCEQVASEYRQLVGRLRQVQDLERLAMPGDACKVCEFRPWCRPFWRWLAAEKVPVRALKNAQLGFAGEITKLVTVNNQWLVHIRWQDLTVRLVAYRERFPQLEHARVGTHVRVLDCHLHGQRHQPHADVSEYSELFIVPAWQPEPPPSSSAALDVGC